jgi:type II secretory pathway component PulK
MKISPHQRASGFAVLMVLVVIIVLSIIVGGLAIFMKVESQLAVNSNDSEKLLWIGRAGMERACWILAQEPPSPTSLKQIWAGGPGDGPETNSPLAGISLADFPVGDGSVSLALTELESKINVNRADTPLLTQVLTAMGVDASAISEVADSIQDWVDTDDNTRPAGAESDYYQGLTPSYYAKNAPIDDLEELQLVKGVTPLMFKGGTAADPNSPFQHHKLGFGNAPGQVEDYPFGLRDVFTPFSSGKININTASANVLLCIPGMDQNSADAVIGFRNSEGGPNGSGVITAINQLVAVIPNQQALQQLERYCGVAGNTYEVHATARVGVSSREFIAILYRNGNNVQIVGFHPK